MRRANGKYPLNTRQNYEDTSSEEDMDDAFNHALMNNLITMSTRTGQSVTTRSADSPQNRCKKPRTTSKQHHDENENNRDQRSRRVMRTDSKYPISGQPNDNTTQDIVNSARLKPVEYRIEYIKKILATTKFKPMVDFDNCTTDAPETNFRKSIVNIRDVFADMGMRIEYLKSGTTGHTFKAICEDDPNIMLAVKVCAYPKDDYGGINNKARPENVELKILTLLSPFVVNRKTPHLVIPLTTFNTSITNFIKTPKSFINLNDKKNRLYKKFIVRYDKGEFEELVSVLVSEWWNGGDLLDYIRNNYEKMTRRTWCVIFFQILFTLTLIQEKYPDFKHNDFKPNNILLKRTEYQGNEFYKYNIAEAMFLIPDVQMQVGIWDFDFACIDGIVENNKVNSRWAHKVNITKKRNQYYDINFFFNTLTSKQFFPQFYKGGVPDEIVEFVHRVVPPRYRNGSKNVNEKCRILIDKEFTTPYKILMTDPLFAKYRTYV